jgi:hypothetical protein
MTHKQRLSLMLIVALACYAVFPGRASGQHTPPPASQPVLQQSAPFSTGSPSQVSPLPVQISETPPVPVRTYAATSCTDQYVKCQDLGGSCTQEIDAGKSRCAHCRDFCQSNSTPPSHLRCEACGFEGK